jgi:plastocyanin
MLRNMSITPEGLFALAACGENVTFAFDTVGQIGIFDTPGAAAPADIPGENARVSVQRTLGAPGIHRYHCTIHPGRYGSDGIQ